MDRILHRISWIGLSVVGAFLVLAAVADLTGDRTAGLPADHQVTFTTLAGQPFTQFRDSNPGAASYLTLLEVGYALHELTFALLFLTIVLIPLRHRRRWAWWACWIIFIPSLGYTLTFGPHDPVTLGRSLAADASIVILLLLTVRTNLTREPLTQPDLEASSDRPLGSG